LRSPRADHKAIQHSLHLKARRYGGEVLPKTDEDGNPITYKEYDVWPKVPGFNGGAEE
jgi:hypothetical protein